MGTLDEIKTASLGNSRFLAMLLGIFAGIGIILIGRAANGILGIEAFHIRLPWAKGGGAVALAASAVGIPFPSPPGATRPFLGGVDIGHIGKPAFTVETLSATLARTAFPRPVTRRTAAATRRTIGVTHPSAPEARCPLPRSQMCTP